MRIALIMLAAGNSRRFGSNKLLYEIDGKLMYRHILEKLMAVAKKTEEKPEANLEKSVTVVTQYKEIEQEASALGAKVYRNPHPDEGISSSLQIGLKANLDADACLFTVSDQPWLTIGTMEALIDLLKVSGKGIGCVSCDGKLGNPCIFTKRYYEELLSITGDKGGKSVIQRHRDDTAILEINDQRELVDMDEKV